jgi:hypothetical protein
MCDKNNEQRSDPYLMPIDGWIGFRSGKSNNQKESSFISLSLSRSTKAHERHQSMGGGKQLPSADVLSEHFRFDQQSSRKPPHCICDTDNRISFDLIGISLRLNEASPIAYCPLRSNKYKVSRRSFIANKKIYSHTIKRETRDKRAMLLCEMSNIYLLLCLHAHFIAICSSNQRCIAVFILALLRDRKELRDERIKFKNNHSQKVETSIESTAGARRSNSMMTEGFGRYSILMMLVLDMSRPESIV